jgi:hypothetical protein
MRRCLILRQGASPLRPRPPFPRLLILRKGRNLSRVRFAGQIRAALDSFLPFQNELLLRSGKGGPRRPGLIVPPVGRQPITFKSTRPPPRSIFFLTEAGLLMEAARVSKRIAESY